MKQIQAEPVKDLAKLVVEALKVVTERECPECEGRGFFEDFDGTYPNCSTCRGTKKLKYSWTPQVGEFVLIDNQPVLVNYVWPDGDSRGIELEYGPHGYTGYSKELIPILHWETIERVLEGVGYSMSVYRHSCFISKSDAPKIILAQGHAKTRQEAVMRSVIQLAKELK